MNNLNHLKKRIRTFSIMLTAFIASLSFFASRVSHAEDFRLVYIPVDDLNVVFSEKQGMFLSWDEFQELWKKAHPAGEEKDESRKYFTITESKFQGKFHENGLIMEGNLKIEKQNDGLKALTIPLGGLAVEEVTLNGKVPALGMSPKGRLELFLEKKGTHELKLKLTAPFTKAKDAFHSDFKLPPATGSFELLAPANYDVQIDGTKLPLGKKTDDGNLFNFALGGRDGIRMTVSKTFNEGTKKTMLTCYTKTLATITPSELKWKGEFDVVAAAKPISILEFALPLGLQVVGVKSDGLSQWTVVEQATTAIAHLEYDAEFTGARKVTIEALGVPELEDSWIFPTAQLLDSTIDTGLLEINYEDNMNIELAKLDFADRLKIHSQKEKKLRIGYWRPDVRVEMKLRPKTRTVAASIVSMIDVQKTRLTMTGSVALVPRNGTLFESTLLVDAQWYPQSVYLDGVSQTFSIVKTDDEKTLKLRIIFDKPVVSNQSVDLLIIADQLRSEEELSEEKPKELSLKTVSVVEADEIEGTLLLRSPAEIQLTVEDSQGIDAVPVADIPGADANVKLGFSFRTKEVDGTLIVSKRKAQVSVESNLTVDLTKSDFIATYLSSFRIRTGVTDTLQFDLAGLASNQVEITKPTRNALRILSQSSEVVGDSNVRRWTVKFNREMRGTVVLKIRIDLPREEGVQAVPAMTVPEATRQAGTIAVRGASDQELSFPDFDGIREIDPSELNGYSGESYDQRLVGSFQFNKSPFTLNISTESHDEVGVIPAVCREAKLSTVISDGSRVLNEALYFVDNRGLQHFTISLPEKATLLSATMNGEPAEVRKEKEDYLIALKQGAGVTTNTTLKISYETAVTSTLLVDEISQKPPVIHDMPILKTSWKLYVPEEKYIVGSTGDIRPTEELSTHNMISELRNALLSIRLLPMIESKAVMFDAAATQLSSPASAPMEYDNNAGADYDYEDAVGIESSFTEEEAIEEIQAEGDARYLEAAKEAKEEAERLHAVQKKLADRARYEAEKASAPARQPTAPTAEVPKDAQEPSPEPPNVPLPPGTDPFDGKPGDRPSTGVVNQPMTPDTNGRPGEGRYTINENSIPNSDKGGEFTKAVSQGLLALSIDLPEKGRPYDFERNGTGQILQIQLQAKQTAHFFAWMICFLLVFLSWTFRKASRSRKALFASGSIFGSLAISGLLPLPWLFIADGLLLGGIFSVVLYFVIMMGSLFVKKPSKQAVATAAVLFSLGLFCLQGEDVFAGDGPATVSKDAPATIYVPYALDQDPQDASRVYLPWKDYQKLTRLANPNAVARPNPLTTKGVVSHMNLAGKVEGSVAKFTATIDLRSFEDDWVPFVVPISQVVFSEVLLDGEEASISGSDSRFGLRIVPANPQPPANAPVGKGANAKKKPSLPPPIPFPVIYVRGKGEHQLVVKFEVKVKQFAATGRINVLLFPIGSGKLSLELPKEDLEISMTGKNIGWDQAGKTVTAAIQHGGPITMQWQPPSLRKQAAFLATVFQATRQEIHRTGIRQRSRLTYEIRQGVAKTLEIIIPEPILVQNVTGANVGEWTLIGKGDEQKLVIQPTDEFSKSTSIDLDLFLKSDDAKMDGDKWRFPAVVPLGVAREKGQVAVIAAPHLNVGVSDVKGLSQIGKNDFSGPAATSDVASWPTLSVYRYSARPIEVTYQVQPLRDNLVTNIDRTIVVEKERFVMSSRFKVTRKGVPISSLQIKAPVGFVFDTLDSPYDLRWTEWKVEDGVIIEIEQVDTNAKNKSKSTAFNQIHTVEFKIDGWLNRDQDEKELTIPQLELVDASQVSGKWSLFLAPGYDAIVLEREGLQPVGLQVLPAHMRSCEAISVPVRIGKLRAFQQNRNTASLKISLTELQARLQANVLTVVSVRDTALAYVSQIKWNIQQSGVREFRFLAPDWLGKDLSFGGHGIRQTETIAHEEDKTIEFIIQLDQNVEKEYTLTISQVQRSPESKNVTAPNLQPLNVENSNSYLIVENRSSDQLDRLNPENEFVEVVQQKDLPFDITRTLAGNTIETLRWLDTSKPIDWKIQTAQLVENLEASVNLAELTIAISNDGSYKAKMHYRVKNRNKQYLPVKFPEKTKIWSVFVDGKPSKPSDGIVDKEKVVLIPIVQRGLGDFSMGIDIVYEGTKGAINKNDGWLGSSEWSIPSPKVIGLPVAETQFAVFLPEDVEYFVGSNTNMTTNSQTYYNLVNKLATLKDIQSISSSYSRGKGKIREKAFGNLKLANPFMLDNSDSVRYFEEDDKTNRLQTQLENQSRKLNSVFNRAAQEQAEQQTQDDNGVRYDFYFKGTEGLTPDSNATPHFTPYNNPAPPPAPKSKPSAKAAYKGSKVQSKREELRDLNMTQTYNLNALSNGTFVPQQQQAGQGQQAEQQFQLSKPQYQYQSGPQQRGGTPGQSAGQPLGRQQVIDQINNLPGGVIYEQELDQNEFGANADDLSQGAALSITETLSEVSIVEVEDPNSVENSEGPQYISDYRQREWAANGIGGGGGFGNTTNDNRIVSQTRGYAQDGQMLLGGGSNPDSGLVGNIMSDEDNFGDGEVQFTTKAGGLSLFIEVPTTENRLYLHKTSDDPVVTLNVSSRDQLKVVYALIWGLLWLTLGAITYVIFHKQRAFRFGVLAILNFILAPIAIIAIGDFGVIFFLIAIVFVVLLIAKKVEARTAA